MSIRYNKNKVLIVGPEFFNYNEAIAKSFESEGFDTKIIQSPVHNRAEFRIG